jgi:HAD superfamily hydrolase (TIGR01549 family)
MRSHIGENGVGWGRKEQVSCPGPAPQVILFDLDGTLYDAARLRWRIGQRLLLEIARSPRSCLRAIRVIRAYRAAHEQLRTGTKGEQANLAEAQLALASSLGRVDQEEVRQIQTRWFEAEALRALRGLASSESAAVLAGLRRRGLRLGVVSDYPARAKLGALGLLEYFEVVVSAQDPGVQRLKPHPAGIHAALELLGSKSNEALYVGDRVDVDASSAKAAGVRFVHLSARRGPHNEFPRIRRLGELEPLLASMPPSDRRL